jgi:hypothetical protein
LRLDGSVYLTGPAEIVAEGEFYFGDRLHNLEIPSRE